MASAKGGSKMDNEMKNKVREFKKLLRKGREVAEQLRSKKGGVIFELSTCSRAHISYTSGGVKIAFCSRCRRPHYPLVFK